MKCARGLTSAIENARQQIYRSRMHGMFWFWHNKHSKEFKLLLRVDASGHLHDLVTILKFDIRGIRGLVGMCGTA